MKALLTALIAAIEAGAIALAGLVLIAVPVLLIWWLEFGLAAEPESIIATIASVWFLGHLSPLDFVLPPETALGFGLPPEALPITVSFVPLGLTLLTVLLALRSGRRFAERGGQGIAGVIGGAAGFAGAAWAIARFGFPVLGIPVPGAVLIAAACFAVGGAFGFVWRSAVLGHLWWHAMLRAVLRRSGRLREALPDFTADVARSFAAVCAGLLGLGALGFTVALIAGYVQIVALSQAMQLDALGVVLLFLLNLLLLPTAVIWGVAWLSGAGFSIGSGTSVSPFETLLGPIPALPIFGAIPDGWGIAAVLAPLLIVLLGAVVGIGLGDGLLRRHRMLVAAAAIPAAAGVLVGVGVLACTALASGSLGPGRLREVGADPLLVAGIVALEVVFGMLLGVIARRIDGGRLREKFRREPHQVSLPSHGAGSASGLTAVQEQDTVPLSRLHPAPPSERESSQRPASEPAPFAEQETVPLEPVPTVVPPLARPTIAPTTPPSSEPLRSSPASPVDQPQASAPEEQPTLPADAEAEEIARAYEWDHPVTPNDPPPGRRPRDWPWSRR